MAKRTRSSLRQVDSTQRGSMRMNPPALTERAIDKTKNKVHESAEETYLKAEKLLGANTGSAARAGEVGHLLAPSSPPIHATMNLHMNVAVMHKRANESHITRPAAWSASLPPTAQAKRPARSTRSAPFYCISFGGAYLLSPPWPLERRRKSAIIF